MPMTTMNVCLPEELKEYVERQTHTGYSTPSEYVCELIREDQKRRAREGLDSGDPISATPEFWNALKRDALAKLNASHAPRKGRKWPKIEQMTPLLTQRPRARLDLLVG